MATKLAWAFGIIFIVIGVLGFVPGITTADGHLLGIFEVDFLHNLIHIATGLVALALIFAAPSKINLFFKVFGVIYGLVTIIGFVQQTNVLGLFAVNMADNVLHLLIAAVALYAGFGMKSEEPMMASPMNSGASM
jgi:hypothetical protein